jgi:HAD superfamily phosphatase (TIGR01668 family)
MWKAIGRKYFRPDKKFKNVSEINLDDLKNDGVKGIILDLDDTLLPSDKRINKEIIDNWLLKAKKEFSLFVVSNNARPDYVKKFCEKFDIPFVARATKPRSKFLQIALGKMNLNKHDVVIIGDRVTTDIFAGKMFGIKAFLVAPLTEMPSRFQKFVYKIEAYVLKAIEPIAEAAPLKAEIKEGIREERAKAEKKAEIKLDK